MNTKELIEELRLIDCTWPENNAILEKAADRIENLQDQVKRLRDVLTFYAASSSYKSVSVGFALQYDPAPQPIQIDKGEKARAALSEGDTKK